MRHLIYLTSLFFAISCSKKKENTTQSGETEKTVEMRTLNRQIKLISKIDSAIKKISNGTYGYCEETGEPIGLKRLIARPIATLSIEAQEKHEKNEKIFADL